MCVFSCMNFMARGKYLRCVDVQFPFSSFFNFNLILGGRVCGKHWLDLRPQFPGQGLNLGHSDESTKS